VKSEVVVIGAGVAGTGAALTAARAGARVTLIDGGTGASVLATGAIDITPWGSGARGATAPSALPPAVRWALDTLGGFIVTEERDTDGATGRPSILLTTAGVVRPARGHDAALLDLAPLGTRRIGVARCPRPGWDADALARAWGDPYTPLEATILRYGDERVIPDADFAARHDDEARLGWLAERLRRAVARASGQFAGLVLPPSLGVERARALELSEQVGLPCGEPTAMPGGPSGLRFERARDRALASSGVERVQARATSVARSGDGWQVTLDGDSALVARAVVLATGGLLGGGIEYAPSDAIVGAEKPQRPRPPLRLTLDAPVALGERGRPLEVAGSLHGAPPESLAWPFARDPLLERAGALVDEDGATLGAPRGLFAAGDLVADVARTWLVAFAAGVRTGSAAALHAQVTPRRA
jgi:glycerol-3-phosphate dehydrogenase subunit B